MYIVEYSIKFVLLNNYLIQVRGIKPHTQTHTGRTVPITKQISWDCTVAQSGRTESCGISNIFIFYKE